MSQHTISVEPSDKKYDEIIKLNNILIERISKLEQEISKIPKKPILTPEQEMQKFLDLHCAIGMKVLMK